MPSNLSKHPLKVLTFAGVFLPGYKGGGPIKTIKNLFEQAGNDISFKLVTSDRDLGDEKPYSSVVCGEWNQVGNASVFYAQPGKQGYRQIAGILREKNYDVVYLNSFFSPRFSFYPLLLTKLLRQRVVLSPRGEFSDGALGLKSLKKKVFIAFYKLLRLHRGTVFQVSSKFEERDLRRVLGPKLDVRVAENIGAQEFGEASYKRTQGVLRAVFVSRISPMKNLLMALESLRNVRSPMVYDIYGPAEDKAYWDRCQKVIETLPEHIQVEHKGPLNPVDVVKTMSGYDAFYLPTKGENYGHAIAEAICAGLPIVIADTTPWRNLQAHGIGWDLPLDNPDAFSAVLDKLATMPDDEYHAMREQVLTWAKNKFSQRDAIEANIALFKYAYEKK
ncbi:glycosyltransferase family 4 protein [Marinobacter sp.]|uniref:glycosyltransferase family 4 protein n=1 Tax=Marinobacter sp. TaxID=50741 RepID=UPI003A90716C